MCLTTAVGDAVAATVAGPARSRTLQVATAGPLHFESNQGQAGEGPQFLARGSLSGWTFSPLDAVFLTKPPAGSAPDVSIHPPGTRPVPPGLRIHLEQGNPEATMSGSAPLTAKVNYLTGGRPEQWRTGITTFQQLVSRVVYPGIDLVWHGTHERLEFDFIVAPGADPGVIGLRFEGMDSLDLDANGDLVLHVGGSEIRQRRPVLFQESAEGRREIPGGYRLDELPANCVMPTTRLVRFQIGEYDRSRPLIIDPVVDHAAAFGGDGLTRGLAVTMDAAGNSYVTGNTTAADFGTRSPLQEEWQGGRFDGDAVVMKFGPDGTLIFATYLGGTGDDVGEGIAVDADGSAVVVGTTSSGNFPVANALQPTLKGFQNAFVAKLNPAGSGLVFSTFLGGSGGDQGHAVALDSTGNVHVVGDTGSTDFPKANPIRNTLGGFLDAFAAKLNPAGDALLYSTYLGGGDIDFGLGLTVAAGEAVVVGQTSGGFPVARAFQGSFGGGSIDGFVARLAADGKVLKFSTFLGGNGNDVARAVAVDPAGAIYVTGTTQSSDFPTKSPFQAARKGLANVFVTKFTPSGEALAYSTFLGGGGVDDGHAIAVDAQGRAHVAGSGSSANFPLVDPVQHGVHGALFRSEDGGTSWRGSAFGQLGGTVNGFAFDAAHPTTFYAANFGGVARTTDGGASWIQVNQGLPNDYVLAVAQDPAAPETLFASVQGGVFKSINGGTTWLPANQGLPASFVVTFAVDPANPRTIYAGTDGGGVFKSEDAGATWSARNSGLSQRSIRTLVVRPGAGARLLAGAAVSGGAGVFGSDDGGNTWSARGNGLPSGWNVSSIAFDPHSGDTIYIAAWKTFGDGGVFRSTDGGGQWTAILQTGFRVNCVAVSPADSNTIYAGPQGGSGQGLLRSIDGGSTWTAVGLRNNEVLALAFPPATPDVMLAGTDAGSDAFVSTLSADGTRLEFSTMLGGTGTEYGRGVAVSAMGRIVVAGYSHSLDFLSLPSSAGAASPAASRSLPRPAANGPVVRIPRSEKPYGFAIGIVPEPCPTCLNDSGIPGNLGGTSTGALPGAKPPGQTATKAPASARRSGINPDTIEVTQAGDSGAGSLRDAILKANASPGSDIQFASNIGVITPLSPLPVITADGILIDGGGLVELDGTSAGDAVGLNFLGANCFVRGLTISNFRLHGINSGQLIRLGGRCVIQKNKGDGIHAFQGVTVETSDYVVINENTGFGILTFGGDVSLNVAQIGSTGIRFNGKNGIRAEAGAVIGQQLHVENNGAKAADESEQHGIFAKRFVNLTNAESNRNKKDGIHSLETVTVDGDFQATLNGGDGIFAELGVSGDKLLAEQNGGWGINAPRGPVELSQRGARHGARFSFNHKGGILALGPLHANNLTVEYCGQDAATEAEGQGIRVTGSFVLVVNAAIEHNRRDGVQASADVRLFGDCSVKCNGGDGIDSGGNVETDGIRVDVNGGWGLTCPNGTATLNERIGYRTSARFVCNQLGGIQAAAVLGDNLSVNGNHGHGIVASTVNLVAREVSLNDGFGLVIGASASLLEVRIVGNRLGGVLFAGGGATQSQALGNPLPHLVSSFAEILGDASPQGGVAAGASQLVGCFVSENGGDGIRHESAGSLVVQGSSLLGNTGSGLRNTAGGGSVIASGNWWGAPSGPGGTGTGQGDEITGAVQLSGWAGEFVPLSLSVPVDTRDVRPGEEGSLQLAIDQWLMPHDTAHVTVSDSRGWIANPLHWSVGLVEGHAQPSLAYRVPVSAVAETMDEVQVVVVSGSQPQFVQERVVRLHVVAAPPTLQLEAGEITPGGDFTLRVVGEPGTKFILQSSSSLDGWSPLATNTVAGTPFQFVRTGARNQPQEFFRAVQIP